MTPPAPARPMTWPSNTQLRSPSTSSTRGTRSRTAAGARLVNRSGGSDQWLSASTMKRPSSSAGAAESNIGVTVRPRSPDDEGQSQDLVDPVLELGNQQRP